MNHDLQPHAAAASLSSDASVKPRSPDMNRLKRRFGDPNTTGEPRTVTYRSFSIASLNCSLNDLPAHVSMVRNCLPKGNYLQHNNAIAGPRRCRSERGKCR